MAAGLVKPCNLWLDHSGCCKHAELGFWRSGAVGFDVTGHRLGDVVLRLGSAERFRFKLGSAFIIAFRHPAGRCVQSWFDAKILCTLRATS